MCVAGIPDAQHDHAARVAAFALAAVAAAASTPIKGPGDDSLGRVRIRAGFNSGACVSSVVGKRSPKFTVRRQAEGSVGCRLSGGPAPNSI